MLKLVIFFSFFGALIAVAPPAEAVRIKLHDGRVPENEAVNRRYLPILKTFLIDQIHGLKVDFTQLDVDRDQPRIDSLLQFIHDHPKPTIRDLALANWYVKAMPHIPTVVFSLYARTETGQESFLRPGWGAYFVGEALIPIAALLDIHRLLYEEPPVASSDDVIQPMASTRSGSIRMDEFSMRIFDAVARSPIHVLTADLRAQIYLKTLLATDSDFAVSESNRISPAMMRRAAAKSLSNDYWTLANSRRMQDGVLENLFYADDLVIRTDLLKVAAVMGGIGLVGKQKEIESYLFWLVDELGKMRAERSEVAKNFVIAAVAFVESARKTSWATPEVDWKSIETRIGGLRLKQLPSRTCETLFVPVLN